MNKGLEWLNYYKEKLQESHQTFRPNGFDMIEKSLNALEVIKKYTKILSDNGCIVCIVNQFDKDTEKEDYKLLKEVLLNEK